MHIIAGLYRRQRLHTPKGNQTRPTASRLREALFNICQNSIEGVHFLDLFAGSGAMGLEALSRGAQSATFVDQDKEAIRCIQQNIAHLKVESSCKVLHGTIFSQLKFLERSQRQFEIIYVDPPYKTQMDEIGYSEKVLRFLDESSLLTHDGLLFLEEDSRYPPLVEDLKKLRLKDSRSMGHTVLQRYEMIPSPLSI